MGRAPCCEKVGLKKGRWSKEEDDILANFIAIHGPRSWRSLPKRAGLLRCGKSCRLRWINYLRADVKRGNFAPHEDRIIINLHSSLGNRWSLIAAHLPGRTDNEIKNYWNSHLSRTIVSLPKTVSEETTPATSVSSVTDNHADNSTNSNSNSSGNTACEPIAIEEDDDNDDDDDEDGQYRRVDNINNNSSTTLHHPDMSVPVQPDMSGTTTTSSAGSCVSFTNNTDQSGLQGPGPLSPLDDNAVLDMIDSLLKNDGWAEEAGAQYGPGLSGLEGEMGRTSDVSVGCDWAEIEAQLWDESVVDLWAGFGDGGPNWDALPDWILSDN